MSGRSRTPHMAHCLLRLGVRPAVRGGWPQVGSNLESRTERPQDGVSQRGTPADSPSESPISEGFFRSLVECGSDALLVSRADGTVIYLNSSAIRILGRESSKVPGPNRADL